MNSNVFQSVEDDMWYYYDEDFVAHGPYETEEAAFDYYERKVLGK